MPRESEKEYLFQSSIRGFSFCGRDRNGDYFLMHRYFNPLYEALVFAAGVAVTNVLEVHLFQSSIRGFSFCGRH